MARNKERINKKEIDQIIQNSNVLKAFSTLEDRKIDRKAFVEAAFKRNTRWDKILLMLSLSLLLFLLALTLYVGERLSEQLNESLVVMDKLSSNVSDVHKSVAGMPQVIDSHLRRYISGLTEEVRTLDTRLSGVESRISVATSTTTRVDRIAFWGSDFYVLADGESKPLSVTVEGENVVGQEVAFIVTPPEAEVMFSDLKATVNNNHQATVHYTPQVFDTPIFVTAYLKGHRARTQLRMVPSPALAVEGQWYPASDGKGKLKITVHIKNNTVHEMKNLIVVCRPPEGVIPAEKEKASFTYEIPSLLPAKEASFEFEFSDVPQPSGNPTNITCEMSLKKPLKGGLHSWPIAMTILTPQRIEVFPHSPVEMLVGQSSPITVTVYAQGDTPLPNTSVTATVDAGWLSVDAQEKVTDANGQVAFSVTPDQPGEGTLTMKAGGAQEQIHIKSFAAQLLITSSINTSSINIRRGPSSTAEIVGGAKTGDKFWVIGKTSGSGTIQWWYKVLYDDGQEAWIAEVPGVEVQGDKDSIPYIETTPYPTPIPSPSPTPKVEPGTYALRPNEGNTIVVFYGDNSQEVLRMPTIEGNIFNVQQEQEAKGHVLGEIRIWVRTGDVDIQNQKLNTSPADACWQPFQTEEDKATLCGELFTLKNALSSPGRTQGEWVELVLKVRIPAENLKR